MRRRIIILSLAATLAGASAVPAFAQSEEKLTGLDRARQATMRALELAASDDVTEAPPAVPPGQAKKDKTDKGKPDSDKTNRATGRKRAEQAIATALGRGNANGNGFGRGHAAEVIANLIEGEAPPMLEADENHGAEVSAMVKTYNELKARERTGSRLPA